MDHKLFKIYNQEDFNRITKGIKVAQCMQFKTATDPSVTEKVLSQLEDLVVSDSLSCSFCNTVFEDKAQQRLHYKLDWHRYNLKQRLHGLKSVSEDGFSLLVEKDDVCSLSASDSDSENEKEATSTSEGGGNNLGANGTKVSTPKNKKLQNSEKRGKESDSSDTECSEEAKEKKMQNLLVMASRHSKVFFENDDGNIFSIYRCLLHNKKEIPELDNEMISQALDSGKKTMWTVIMLGGGHFAGAVFQDGEPILHKTFHSYTVRAKQGSAQNSRDMRTTGSHPKSAGASLRRYNEAAFVQHVQEILECWSSHITNSSLILYRAVGPQNRSVLFGGKNPPLDKNDSRLRPLPFPTRRATFSEVKRVYDILTTVEIYGLAADFTDCFPISPRQPIRKKVSKSEILSETPEKDGVPGGNSANGSGNSSGSPARENEKPKSSSQITPEKQPRNSRAHIDRAKPRKSPLRPLPDIVARLAQSSSEEDSDSENELENALMKVPWIEQEFEIQFNENLQAFQDTVPQYLKKKKARCQKRKVKKERGEETLINEILSNSRIKLWTAVKLGDNELLHSSLSDLSAEITRCEELESSLTRNEDSSLAIVKKDNMIKLVNDPNEDGNTMLHLAALGGHLRIVWSLLEIGSDPCNRNKKLQTPYSAATDKETRNTFRRFMGANPNKFNYSKSQIPGPLTDEIEQEELEKKKLQKKTKREREKMKKKEFELKKQEAEEKQRFLNLSDREKRAFAAEQRLREQGAIVISRCFQCGTDMSGKVPFEYNYNRFCSMPCLKEHRLHNKFIL